MSKTIDMGTPIFGELNAELGELPEITVHDFDVHAFDFLRSDEETTTSAASEEPTEATETGRREDG